MARTIVLIGSPCERCGETEKLASGGCRACSRAYQRKYHLNYRYGISAERQQSLMTSQEGRCAVCGEVLKPGKETHLDHDHVTGKVRGFLCRRCNSAIGMVQDSPAVLRRAADYLERHGKRAAA